MSKFLNNYILFRLTRHNKILAFPAQCFLDQGICGGSTWATAPAFPEFTHSLNNSDHVKVFEQLFSSFHWCHSSKHPSTAVFSSRNLRLSGNFFPYNLFHNSSLYRVVQFPRVSTCVEYFSSILILHLFFRVRVTSRRRLSLAPGFCFHLNTPLLLFVSIVALPSPAVFLPCPPQELGVLDCSSMPMASPLFLTSTFPSSYRSD